MASLSTPSSFSRLDCDRIVRPRPQSMTPSITLIQQEQMKLCDAPAAMAFSADSPFSAFEFCWFDLRLVSEHSVEQDPAASEAVRAFCDLSKKGDRWHCLSCLFVSEGAQRGLRPCLEKCRTLWHFSSYSWTAVIAVWMSPVVLLTNPSVGNYQKWFRVVSQLSVTDAVPLQVFRFTGHSWSIPSLAPSVPRLLLSFCHGFTTARLKVEAARVSLFQQDGLMTAICFISVVWIGFRVARLNQHAGSQVTPIVVLRAHGADKHPTASTNYLDTSKHLAYSLQCTLAFKQLIVIFCQNWRLLKRAFDYFTT